MNSKRKGNKAEREVTKLFKEWTGFEFARVPSSGGLRWQRTSDTVGDILCSDKVHYLVFPFSVEVKNHKECDLHKIILSNKNNDFLDFWKQAQDDAKRGEKIPMLLARYNRMKSSEHYLAISITTYILIMHLIPLINPRLRIRIPGSQSVMVINSFDFFKSDYQQVLKALTDGKR